MTAKIKREELFDWIIVLLLTSAMVLICNLLGYGIGFIESLPGMAWIVLFTLAGMMVKPFVPIDLPDAAYISIIAILVSMPVSPVSDMVIEQVNQINLLAICTPILAYAGVTVGKDWPAFKKIGYKGVIVSLVVIVGTVLSCVILSEIFFRIF